MSRFVEFVAFPATWYTILCVAEILLITIFGVRWNSATGTSVWKILVCIALAYALFITTYFAFVVLSRNTYKESKVDVSPISEIRAERFAFLERAMDDFEGYEFIKQYKTSVKSEDDAYLRTKGYSLLWVREKPYTHLKISVIFYRDEQAAIDSMESSINNAKLRDDKYSYTKYDNGADALLFDSRMLRDGSEFFFPDSSRRISSTIRLGNAIISLTEDTNYYSLKNNVSTEFISLLCDLIRE